jgi:hypothetical protein
MTCPCRRNIAIGNLFDCHSRNGVAAGIKSASRAACIPALYPSSAQFKLPLPLCVGLLLVFQLIWTWRSPNCRVRATRAALALASELADAIRSRAWAKMELRSRSRSNTSHSKSGYLVAKATRTWSRSSSHGFESKEVSAHARTTKRLNTVGMRATYLKPCPLDAATSARPAYDPMNGSKWESFSALNTISLPRAASGRLWARILDRRMTQRGRKRPNAAPKADGQRSVTRDAASAPEAAARQWPSPAQKTRQMGRTLFKIGATFSTAP